MKAHVIRLEHIPGELIGYETGRSKDEVESKYFRKVTASGGVRSSAYAVISECKTYAYLKAENGKEYSVEISGIMKSIWRRRFTKKFISRVEDEMKNYTLEIDSDGIHGLIEMLNSISCKVN